LVSDQHEERLEAHFRARQLKKWGMKEEAA
jgi:hypothetical protein